MAERKTWRPLLVSLGEVSFQLNVPADDVKALIDSGELKAVLVRGHVLVTYESLVKFARRAPPIRSVTDTRVSGV